VTIVEALLVAATAGGVIHLAVRGARRRRLQPATVPVRPDFPRSIP
jgi:hypothetical protein